MYDLGVYDSELYNEHLITQKLYSQPRFFEYTPDFYRLEVEPLSVWTRPTISFKLECEDTVGRDGIFEAVHGLRLKYVNNRVGVTG